MKTARQFPPFSLECSGYQKGYPTLLREKVKRIAEEKAAAKDVKRGNYGDRAAMLKSAEADGRLKDKA